MGRTRRRRRTRRLGTPTRMSAVSATWVRVARTARSRSARRVLTCCSARATTSAATARAAGSVTTRAASASASRATSAPAASRRLSSRKCARLVSRPAIRVNTDAGTDRKWEVHVGPGGHNQWRVGGNDVSPSAPSADGSTKQNISMLTSDVSLTKDPAYFEIVKRFAGDMKAFDDAFSRAWYKLTTRDMGPHSRCVGKDVPPAQPFQYPLPEPVDPSEMPSFEMSSPLAADVRAALFRRSSAKKPVNVQHFVDLAWSCASTFRHTDFMGGCNGARIMLSPQKDWPQNSGNMDTINLLRDVQRKYSNLSWADLLVFAGNVAIEVAGGSPMRFCPGRTDAAAGDMGSQYLTAPDFGADVHNDIIETTYRLKQSVSLIGLTLREATVLQGGRRSLGMLNGDGDANRPVTAAPGIMDNDWFRNLVNLKYKLVEGVRPDQYVATNTPSGKPLYMGAVDMAFISDPELASITIEYAADVDAFKTDFAAAWTKLMNLDRFDGPTNNVCDRNGRSVKVG